jgi:hypothetical protein
MIWLFIGAVALVIVFECMMSLDKTLARIYAADDQENL